MALLSVEGDADIYASTTNRQPSHDSYEFGVASCGLDLLVLPAQRANKKVYLGVHGHIRHPNTTYLLFVILPDQEDIRRYQVRLPASATAAHNNHSCSNEDLSELRCSSVNRSGLTCKIEITPPKLENTSKNVFQELLRILESQIFGRTCMLLEYANVLLIFGGFYAICST